MRISQPLIRLRANQTHQPTLSLSQTERLAEAIPVSDKGTDSDVSMFNIFMMQLFIHATLDTEIIDGVRMNRYTGLVVDGFGLYPERMNQTTLDEKTGKFHIDPKWGLMSFLHDGSKRKFIVGDMHRVSENHFLAASHLFVHKLHNKLLDEGIARTYEEAKEYTLACMSRVFCDCLLQHLGPQIQNDESQLLQARDRHTRINLTDRTPGALMSSMESALAAMRWAHAMIASDINGRHIFDRAIKVADITMHDLLAAPAKRFGHELGVAMTEMNHILANKHIAMLTMGRHATEQVGTFEQVTNLLNMTHHVDAINEDTPLWLGMLMEGTVHGNGLVGPVGAELLCLLSADALHSEQGRGLYLNVQDINRTMHSVIDFVESPA